MDDDLSRNCRFNPNRPYLREWRYPLFSLAQEIKLKEIYQMVEDDVKKTVPPCFRAGVRIYSTVKAEENLINRLVVGWDYKPMERQMGARTKVYERPDDD